jgi:Na+/melibiose symporter-like transporter
MEDVGGFRFVLGVLASVVAVGIGLLLVFVVFDRAAMAWGLFGAFAVFVVALLIFAWFYDRRQVRDYPE